MATRAQGAHLDFLKVGKIIDAQMNPLTTAARTTLGGTLGSTHKGLLVWDSDLNTLYAWGGSSWVAIAGTQSGLTPKGNVAFNAAEPGVPLVGDLYVFNTAGTNTWEGSTPVQVGDQVYWDGTAWQFIQGNVLAASDTVAGVIEIATQAEVNTGTDALRAVTPATLAGRPFAKVYFNGSVTTVADTPLTINHALGLQNRDSFVLSFKVGNSEYIVDVDSTDINNCTITTNAAVTGSVTVIGY